MTSRREDIAKIIDPEPWTDVNPYKPEWMDHDHFEYDRKQRKVAIMLKVDKILSVIDEGEGVGL